MGCTIRGRGVIPLAKGIQPTMRESSETNGAAAVIRKPFQLDALLETVEQYCG